MSTTLSWVVWLLAPTEPVRVAVTGGPNVVLTGKLAFV